MNDDEKIVEWQSVQPDDPVYSVTSATIDSYIKDLKDVYIRMTGCSQNECEMEFKKNAASLEFLRVLLSHFNQSSVAQIRDSSTTDSVRIIQIINSLKLPSYTNTKNNKRDKDLQDDNPSTKTINRELHYLGLVMEAKYNQEKAEKESQYLKQLLVKVLPKDINLEDLLSQNTPDKEKEMSDTSSKSKI